MTSLMQAGVGHDRVDDPRVGGVAHVEGVEPVAADGGAEVGDLAVGVHPDLAWSRTPCGPRRPRPRRTGAPRAGRRSPARWRSVRPASRSRCRSPARRRRTRRRRRSRPGPARRTRRGSRRRWSARPRPCATTRKRTTSPCFARAPAGSIASEAGAAAVTATTVVARTPPAVAVRVARPGPARLEQAAPGHAGGAGRGAGPADASSDRTSPSAESTRAASGTRWPGTSRAGWAAISMRLAGPGRTLRTTGCRTGLEPGTSAVTMTSTSPTPPARTRPVESTWAAARPSGWKKMVASGMGLPEASRARAESWSESPTPSSRRAGVISSRAEGGGSAGAGRRGCDGREREQQGSGAHPERGHWKPVE